MPRKIITAVALTAAVTTVAGCKPSLTNPDKPRTVTIWISPGTTTITKEHYGLWGAGATATSDCRWSITQSGKVVQSGGVHDKMIIGSALRGAVVTLGAACGKFGK